MTYPSNSKTNSESVAQEQLKAFIEAIESPYGRVAYVMDRIEHCRGISEHAMHRATRLAGEVLNVTYEKARMICTRAWLGLPVDYEAVGHLRPSVVGYVYLARRMDQPHLVKVGFSTDPTRRERQLASGGPGLRIFRTFIGTMLDEHAVHCDRRALRVEGEWFRARAA